jgi:L-threonylcarbamoyladenylate synthase
MAAKPSEIAGLDEALDALRVGELVVYPTETFYALGADPFSPDALERVFALKGRDPQRPIALIAADLEMALGLAREVPPNARRLAEVFWPGPLTLVLPARDDVPRGIGGPDGCVGVRVSPHPIARALASGLGRPITATSANRSGRSPATTLSAARNELGDKVKVYLEGGTLGASAPSTVVSVDVQGMIHMIRPGAISERQLWAALTAGALK